MSDFKLASLSGSAAVAALLVFAAPGVALAQTKSTEAQSGTGLSEVVITGSRIRRTDTESAAPVTVLTGEDMVERGYTNIGQLLNTVTSNTPSFPISQANGFPAGGGGTTPNLFNLGAGRTLSLVNGRRTVTTSSGLGEPTVSSGAIPGGLIKRVEIINAGGGAIYGSDAIAGVVNYILKDDFEGLEMDAQYGISSRGDNPKYDYHVTWGKNFLDGRANIAVDLEYSKTRPLYNKDRPWTGNASFLYSNPLNGSNTDGQPPQLYSPNGGATWQYNREGVFYSTISGAQGALLRLNGTALQATPDGHVGPYDPGVFLDGGSNAVGGQGLSTNDFSTFAAGSQRYSGSVIGHYDITDHMKLSGEFFYTQNRGYDPQGTSQIFRTINNTGAFGPVVVNKNNPFLSAQDIATLSAASPTFASGGNIYEARFFDILPSRNRPSGTDTWRGLISLDGDFSAFDRDFYYSVSYSRGETDGFSQVYAANQKTIDNALNATRNAAGQIVCSINADAITTNDDAACVPLNPFGSQTASPAAVAYVSALSGSRFHNVQNDFLATMGGDVIRLPGGTAKFSLAYEHRAESVELRNYDADKDGRTNTSIDRDGKYNTNEYSGELLVPIFGGDFSFPLMKALEANGSYRYVDNSIAGKEKVWGFGGRWDVGYGLTFRATKSRNFRAPTLTQLLSPQIVQRGQPLFTDPCDADRLNGGNFAANRLKNCQADFAAHPGYGPLAGFQDPAENAGLLDITSGGNPDLKNEVSKTTTYGMAFQPTYVPGLTFTADRVQVHLKDGFISLSPASFAAACYDAPTFPTDICSNFTRNDQGWITQGKSVVYNAGFINVEGEIYNLSYRFPIGRYFNDANYGTLDLAVEGTHTTKYESQTQGGLPSRSDDTTGTPDWRVRYDLRYSRGPLRFFWSVQYLPPEKSSRSATIETDAVPKVKENYVHTTSVSYNFSNFTFRAGVNNVFDEAPSYPTRTYGDVFGRQYFMGVRARF